ncbi:MAG TPA: ribbon-helix-helix protein, CopG family [Chloroflexota bacterium]|nr:ribbon-helix-helix protein, CopG family [Chloroflexota bacterium]
MATATANFSIRLSEETKERIDSLARAIGRPRNYVIAEAIERYLEEESWQIAEIQAGVEEDNADAGIPHDEVMRDAYEVIRQAEERSPS